MQKSGYDSRPYQIFLEVVGLERGEFSLVSTVEELLERKSSCSGLVLRQAAVARSLYVVRLRTKAMEFVGCYCLNWR
jgi:hypothetical protein